MEYILPVFPGFPDALLKYPRLYAYPRVPDAPGDVFIILDSGAFAMIYSGQKMTPQYCAKLGQHYQLYCDMFGADRVMCIAPDVFLDPDQTLGNFRAWHRAGRVPVAPVFHSTTNKRWDLYSIATQVKIYAQFPLPYLNGRPFLALSSPSLSGIESANVLPKLCSIIRQTVKCAWLHVLGVGWSPDDIRAWRRAKCIDSVDSIAYYTSAQAGEQWRPAYPPPGTWQEIATQNALAAIEVARGGGALR